MTVSPVGPRERDPVLIERSNLVNISKLVVKEVIKLMMTKMQTMLMMRRMKMKISDCDLECPRFVFVSDDFFEGD